MLAQAFRQVVIYFVEPHEVFDFLCAPQLSLEFSSLVAPSLPVHFERLLRAGQANLSMLATLYHC